jgi:hypothetical protein
MVWLFDQSRYVQRWFLHTTTYLHARYNVHACDYRQVGVLRPCGMAGRCVDTPTIFEYCYAHKSCDWAKSPCLSHLAFSTSYVWKAGDCKVTWLPHSSTPKGSKFVGIYCITLNFSITQISVLWSYTHFSVILISLCKHATPWRAPITSSSNTLASLYALVGIVDIHAHMV